MTASSDPDITDAAPQGRDPDAACPGCGAPENAHHVDGCDLKPFGVRPCCGTLIWPGVDPTHRAWCEWLVGLSHPMNTPYQPDPSTVWAGLRDPRNTARASATSARAKTFSAGGPLTAPSSSA